MFLPFSAQVPLSCLAHPSPRRSGPGKGSSKRQMGKNFGDVWSTFMMQEALNGEKNCQGEGGALIFFHTGRLQT